MNTRKNPERSSSQCDTLVKFVRPGFALIATISVMILLVMIALAMLSLSSIETRNTISSRDREVAQANARTALMIAIGELQKSLGPDQRVTATASIFDSDPTTPAIEGVNLMHTVGVWSTVDANGTPIIYQHPDGYHLDKRNPADPDFNDHRENPVSWLISGGQQANFDPRTATLTEGTDAIALGNENGMRVLAPLVETNDNTDVTAEPNGRYAYHVTDLGMAAPLVQTNRNVGREPSAATADDGGYANLYTGTKRPFERFPETAAAFSDISADALVADPAMTARYVSDQTLSFMANGNPNAATEDFLKLNDQSYTARNSALFVDTLRGGLRTDLTPFLQGTQPAGTQTLVGTNGPILTDLEPMLTHERFRMFSPKFGALRDFLRVGDEAGTARTIDPRAPLYGNGGFQQAYPDMAKVAKHGIHPQIVEYSVYHLPVIDDSAATNISVLLYPRVTLWNPYNVTINAANYFVHINHRDFYRLEVSEINGQPNPANPGGPTLPRVSTSYIYNSSGNSVIAGDGAKSNRSTLCFYLDPIDIEPGQSLVFTPAHAGNQPIELRDGNISQNILSARANPANLSSFSRSNLTQAAPTLPTPNFNTPLDWRITGGFYFVSGGISTSAHLRLAANNTSSYLDLFSGGTVENPTSPLVHSLDNHNWIRVNQARFRTIDGSERKVLQNITDNPATLIPDSRTKLGLRFKAHTDTAIQIAANPDNLWHYPLIELFNLRASFYRRTPWDWVIHLPGDDQEFYFGPFAGELFPAPEYNGPFMLPQFTNGVAETSPFMDSMALSNLRHPLFEIPPAGLEAYSFGQFRSVNFSHEPSTPSFILGESLSPVTSPRDQSAFALNDYIALWSRAWRASQMLPNATWWQDELFADRNYVAYDYRYEVNHALWDQYFMSTLPANTDLTTLTEAGSFPNQNIRVSSDSGDTLTQPEASMPDRIAQHLNLQNHHSVNSTNLQAWKALLTMNLGLNINGRNTDNDAVPFPGMATPLDDGGIAVESDHHSAWHGYRQLDTAEIDTLAANIVEQVKRRAPFVSISDFVNRRLVALESDPGIAPAVSGQTETDLLSYGGSIEVAIRKAGFNTNMQEAIYRHGSQADYRAPDTRPGIVDTEPYATISAPEERFANAPAHLTQGKIMETIGASLTSRSDTFRIRAYGEALDANGSIKARAWCEAVVQRSVTYLDLSDDASVKPDDLTSDINRQYGRRFKLQSFRWMGSEELS